MIPIAALALALVGLVAIWAARDVVLRLHRGSEAAEALRVAHETREAVREARETLEAAITKQREEWERVRSEHVAIKAKVTMGGRR